MVIILIRRFARIDREEEFLALFRDQRPRENAAFLGETLTRIGDGRKMPAHVPPILDLEPGCVNFLNVARWTSWEAFAAEFAPQLANPLGHDPEIETQASRITVLSFA